MFSQNCLRTSKVVAYTIVKIPKPWKMPPENYLEPTVWKHKFVMPSQVRPRVFVNNSCNYQLGPSTDIGKRLTYKNPEYYSYHPYSYYNLEEDLNCKRCRCQPSPFKTPCEVLVLELELASEKCP